MKVNIIGTILERFPQLVLTINEEKGLVTPYCKLDKELCRDPKEVRDDIAISVSQGESPDTYHIAHFFSSPAESCKVCPRNKEKL